MWPTLFHIQGSPVPSYDVLVASGYLIGTLWIHAHKKELEATEGEFWALLCVIVLCALLGAKLGYILLSWSEVLADPRFAWRHWRMGWVFWPGLATTFLGGRLFQKVYNRLYRPRRYLPVADYFTTGLALGHVFGRIGCFLEGCCHGRATGLPWGIRFTLPSGSVPEELLGVALHPTQLYEALGEAALFVFFAYRILPGIRAGRYRHGTAFFGYILLYALLRFVVECFRGDDRGNFLSPALSPSQWFSLAGMLAAAFALYRNGLIERDPCGRSLYL